MDLTALNPVRLVLEGVPKVAFYSGGPRCPEDICWPSTLRAALEYLGDPQVGCRCLRAFGREGDWQLGCSYALHVVTSGIGFQQLWLPGDWEYADDVTRLTPEPAGPYRHALEAMGYPYEILVNPGAKNAPAFLAPLGAAADEATLRARIAASLAAGRPVVALGVLGPPEAGLVTGYDEGGDVLIGWSFFQQMPEFGAGLEFEPSGEYRARGWFANTPAIILLGEAGERPRLKDSLRAAYLRAVELVRTEEMNGYRGGLAALDAWAEAVADDANWPAGDMATLRTRYARHTNLVGAVAEGRWYAAVAIAGHAVTEDRPAPVEHLLAAAACYARIHRLMWDVWACAGGIGDDDAKVARGTTPEARRRIAALLREARAVDDNAAEHLERAAS